MTPNSKIGFGKYYRFTFTPMCMEKQKTILPSKDMKEYQDLIANNYEKLSKNSKVQGNTFD